MKCLETEKLISYAYHLMDESAASQVRAHLGECPRCRQIVEKHGRLGALLDEWKAVGPTPGFDARVRQAVETQPAGRERWSFWGWDWTHSLALASLGVLMVAGAVWFTRSHQAVSHSSGIGTQHAQQATGPLAPAQSAGLHAPDFKPPVGVEPVHAVPRLQSASAFSNDDKDVLALEDYDLAANFDLLSELHKGAPRDAD